MPPPNVETDKPTQMLVTSLDYSNYIGRIAIGRLSRGTLKTGQQVVLVKKGGEVVKNKVKELYAFEGLGKVKVEEVQAGDICAVMGLENFEIGDTIADPENPEALPRVTIDEPTMSMQFTINDSPFFGKEGTHVTSRK